jgi:nucleoside-diphosphate kinase
VANERSLVMFKPDVEERGLVNKVLEIFTDHGLIPTRCHFATLNDEFVDKFYEHHTTKEFYSNELKPYMTRNRVYYIIFEGVNMVERIKNFVGQKTDPKDNDPKTLRAKYGLSKQENSIHRSDSPESAEREIRLFEEYIRQAS